jgi:glutamyl/glutaminyl-tRNA synthetase
MIVSGRKPSVRLSCAETTIFFTGAFLGGTVLLSCRLRRGFRFAAFRAYQLAVTVDDDLLASRKWCGAGYFALHAKPKYAHIPLLLDSKGERLTKRELLPHFEFSCLPTNDKRVT